MINKIKYIFEEVYKKFSGFQLYEMNLENELTKKHILSFHSLLQEKYRGSIDEDFLLNFIVFQFRIYENANTRLGRGKVYVNWILGKKALQRWEKKPENWLYWNNIFIKKHSIKIKMPKVEENLPSIKFTEHIERKRFYNQERGLIHCRELDLFNRYSRECLKCIFKQICGG